MGMPHLRLLPFGSTRLGGRKADACRKALPAYTLPLSTLSCLCVGQPYNNIPRVGGRPET